MSKWDKYKVYEQPSASRWDKYKVNKLPENKSQINSLSQVEDNSLGVVGKSFNRGFASLADLPQTALSLTESALNLPAKAVSYISGKPEPYNLNYWSNTKPISENIKEFANERGSDWLDKPKINKNSLGKKLLSNSAETAGSFIGGGAAGKALQGARALKAAKFFGAPNSGKELANLAKSGAVLGAGAGTLEELGADPLTAQLGAAVAIPSTGFALKKTNNLLNNFASKVKNPIINTFGLNKGKLNEKALQAANNLKVELPAAAVTDSKVTAFADQYAGKTPFFGDMLAAKYAKTQNQTLDALENLYDQVGPKRTPETTDNLRALYDKHIALLPENAAISPKTTLSSIDDILAKLDSPGLHKDGLELKKYLETVKKDLAFSSPATGTIGGKSFALPKNLKEQIEESIPVKDLIGLKRNVNNTVQWDDLKGVKSLLANFQKNVSENISEYGKKNPKWHENYRNADSLFGKIAKRERLEELLSGKSINAATDNFSYNSLSKIIHNKKTASELQRLVSPENYKKIQDLGEIAKAMAQKSARVPNPSGTAPTAAAGAAGAAFITGLFHSPVKTTLGGAGSALTAYGVTKLITSQKFLDKALSIASKEKPTPKELMVFNSEVKKATGLSVAAINSAYARAKGENN